MDKSVKKKIFGIISLVFWVCMFLIARKIRFQWKENPILVTIMLTGLVVHIFWYQNKLSKLKKEKKKIKADNTEILKTKIKLDLDPKSFPEKITHLHLIAEKWGVDNEVLREDLYENTHNDELWELKELVEREKEQLEEYLLTPIESPEFNALRLTFQAYNDLGLWTWEKN